MGFFWFGGQKERRRLVERQDELAQELARQSARVDELHELRLELDKISLEWQDWFNKFNTLYARLSKAQRRVEADDEPAEAPINPAALRLLGRM